MLKQGSKIKRAVRANLASRRVGEPIDCLQRPGTDNGLCGAPLALCSGVFTIATKERLELEGFLSIPVEDAVDCPNCAAIYKNEFKP